MGMFLYAIHDWGAVSVLFGLGCMWAGRGEGGSERLVSLAARKLWIEVLFMGLTGVMLYTIRGLTDPEELGLAVPGFAWWVPWIHSYFGMFGNAFISTIGHANIFKPYPVGPLMLNHAIGLS